MMRTELEQYRHHHQLPAAAGGTAWFPGKTVYPVRGRAEEIAKSREELLGLLKGVPESDFELSLTDLVENKSDLLGRVSAADSDSAADDAKAKAHGVEEAVHKIRKARRRSHSDRIQNQYHKQKHQQQQQQRANGGVLLKVFMPISLTSSSSSASSRSLTRSASVLTPLDSSISREREASPTQPGCCWSLSWERGKGLGRSRRQSQID